MKQCIDLFGAPLLAVLLALTACTSSNSEEPAGSGGNGGGPGWGGDDISGCKEPVEIQSPTEIDAMLPADWPVGANDSTSDPITPDLISSQELVISINDLAYVPVCPECNNYDRSFLSRGHDGVQVESNGTILRAPAATIFRLRVVTRDMHPTGYHPTALVYPACAEPCPSDTRRCLTDQICYGGEQRYCEDCLDRPEVECVCYAHAGAQPDGTDCYYGGPVGTAGTCQDGACL